MQEVEGSTPTGGTCPNDFFRSNRPGYPHPVSSELENSGIRVAVSARINPAETPSAKVTIFRNTNTQLPLKPYCNFQGVIL